MDVVEAVSVAGCGLLLEGAQEASGEMHVCGEGARRGWGLAAAVVVAVVVMVFAVCS